MKEAVQASDPGSAPYRPMTPVLVGSYGVAHLLLDWISFIHETPPLNITPWNPTAGLALAFLLACGPWAAAWVALALVMADILVRGLPVGLGLTIASNLGVATVYGSVAWLLRTRCDFLVSLNRLRDLLWLFALGPAGAVLVAFWFVGFLAAGDWFAWSDMPRFTFRYWVGDVIGIVVVAPLLLIHSGGGRGPPRPKTAMEGSVQGAAIVLGLALVFGLPPGSEGRLFYLLFLPAIWIAVRHGLEGAALAVALTQVGLIAAIQLEGYGTPAMVSFQLLMLAIAVTTQLLGAVVGERRRIEARLKDREAALAHTIRLTEAGEMVSALAHELNQPLAAAISYGRAARKALPDETALAPVGELLEKSIVQAERADQVMRGLRGFLRKGNPWPAKVNALAAIEEVRDLAAGEALRQGVRLRFDLPPSLPPVRVDRVQLQQVLLNLIRNGIEAATGTAPPREVTVAVSASRPGVVDFRVRDTGPGIAPEIRDRLFQPFATTKPSGMGLGLSISASLVEAHGGRLTVESPPEGGAKFLFSLPVAQEEDDDLD